MSSKKNRQQEAQALVSREETLSVLKGHYKEITDILKERILDGLRRSRGIGINSIHQHMKPGIYYNDVLSEANESMFFGLIRNGVYFTEKKISILLRAGNLNPFLSEMLVHFIPLLKETEERDPQLVRTAMYRIQSTGILNGLRKKLVRSMNDRFTEEEVREALRVNPHFKKLIARLDEKEAERLILENGMIERIPEDPTKLYPAARLYRRHFVLHIGPTNSGKTYAAMQKLRAAGSGIYLAPLRLLAYEQYETMNRDGYPCSMITGEERIDFPGADFQSSTIEMANLTRFYECAVIDECQMIADTERGGSWTAAILGLCAREIHVCLAPEAEKLLIDLIRACKDSFEIVRHERQTELLIDENSFVFPDSLADGDAVIVFSRANVHAVAAEIRRHHRECSVIYGALPYDVRHEEARKFQDGETKIVVATDAIGMGLNLPIRRIVFLEGAKFDGRAKRELFPSEVKQIAGRAGRFGIYDVGYVTAEEDIKDVIRNGMLLENRPLKEAVLSFPESLLGVEAPLSDVIESWVDWEIGPGYRKEDLKQVLKLVRMIEEESPSKELTYELATIPFDEDEFELLSIWRDMAECEMHGEHFDTEPAMLSCRDHTEGLNMEKLEGRYKMLDLLYFYNESFGQEEKNPEILEVKREISGQIIKLLEEHMLQERVCRRCGRKLKWNHPSSVCDKCRMRSYGRRYRY